MKTTIEIPEDLHKKTKIRAIESGLTLKQIVLNSLERELQVSPLQQGPDTSYWANRKLIPEFARARLEVGKHQWRRLEGNEPRHRLAPPRDHQFAFDLNPPHQRSQIVLRLHDRAGLHNA